MAFFYLRVFPEKSLENIESRQRNIKIQGLHYVELVFH